MVILNVLSTIDKSTDYQRQEDIACCLELGWLAQGVQELDHGFGWRGGLFRQHDMASFGRATRRMFGHLVT